MYPLAKSLEFLGERGRSEQYKIVNRVTKRADLDEAVEALTGTFGYRNMDMFLKTLEFTFERLADYVENFGSVTLRSKIDSDWNSFSGFYESDPAKMVNIIHVSSPDGIQIPFQRQEVVASEVSPELLYAKYSFYAKLLRNFAKDLR